MDVHSKQTRSYNMSRIRSAHTKPEMPVRKFLHAQGYRYTLHNKKLSGKPDIVLPKYKTIILINGCFWHGHSNCKYYTVPKTRTGWWLNKINTNKAIDEIAVKALRKAGWKIIIIWEYDLMPAKIEKHSLRYWERWNAVFYDFYDGLWFLLCNEIIFLTSQSVILESLRSQIVISKNDHQFTNVP